LPSKGPDLRAKVLRLLLALINGALALAFYSLVVHRYGVGGLTDLVFATGLLVNLLYTVTLGQLNEVLVPYFIQLGEEDRIATAYWNLTAAVLTGGALLAAGLFFPLARLAPLIFPGIAAQDSCWLHQLLWLNCSYCVIFCAWTVKSCFLVARGRCCLMQSLLLLGNGSAVLWLAVFARPQEPAQIVVAQLISAAVLLLFPVAGTSLAHYQPGHIRHHVVEAYGRIRWLVVNAAICRAEPLFDSIIAAYIGSGAVTVFYLFQRLVGFTHAVVQNGYLLPLSRRLAEHAHGNRFRSLLREGTAEALAITAALLAATAAGLVGLRWVPVPAFHSFARVFQQHGVLLLLLAGYAAGVILVKIYSTVLYILRREYFYLQVSLAGFVAGVLLKVSGACWLGLPGLALGNSAAALVAAAAVYLALLRVLHPAATAGEPLRVSREKCGS
jgi:peptidoglycan biosynthesis protein MviN/MurJ (putative lipid II flippase)